MPTQTQAKASIKQLVERYRGVSDRAGVTEANVVGMILPIFSVRSRWSFPTRMRDRRGRIGCWGCLMRWGVCRVGGVYGGEGK